MSARVDPEIAARMRSDPDGRLEAIVTAKGKLDDLLGQLPSEVLVEHRYRLIGSVAVLASGRVLQRVADLSTVAAIEPVRGVSHCEGATS